jgi:hypothetical protein
MGERFGFHMEAKKMHRYLLVKGAHRVIGVLRAAQCGWRGKITLGEAAGVRGRNEFKSRPVETAVRLGLLEEEFYGGAYEYQPTQLGLDVLKEIGES